MATHEQRIAELERQLAELSRDFAADRYTLEQAFAAGRESVSPLQTFNEMRPERQAGRAAVPSRHPRHLRVVEESAS
jgi:hypothetical protein